MGFQRIKSTRDDHVSAQRKKERKERREGPPPRTSRMHSSWVEKSQQPKEGNCRYLKLVVVQGLLVHQWSVVVVVGGRRQRFRKLVKDEGAEHRTPGRGFVVLLLWLCAASVAAVVKQATPIWQTRRAKRKCSFSFFIFLFFPFFFPALLQQDCTRSSSSLDKQSSLASQGAAGC